MFENIHADTIRFYQTMHGDRLTETIPPLDILRLLSGNAGLQALVIYRFGRWLNELKKSGGGSLIALLLYPAYRLLSACTHHLYGIDLAQSAEIAPGLYIGHFGGIEVKNCRIGSRCAIQQQVKLGPVEIEGSGLVIGKGVWIGAHANICGNFFVGDGATIGAGAVVTHDIPGSSLVLGNPGRVVQRNYDNRSFL